MANNTADNAPNRTANNTTNRTANNTPNRAATLRDCVYGMAVGDALGVPYEFMERGSFECTDMVGGGVHGRAPGTWSDDTSMALAICDSYRELGHIDCDDIRKRFNAWYSNSAYTVDGLFDVGNATAHALNSGHGCDGEMDNGNGSIMRTVPLAFMDATDDEVRDVSAITHAHRISTDACVRIVDIARRLAAGESVADAVGARDEDVDDVRSSGFVLDTYDAALWCLANTDNYADCVLRAVNLGEDSDTTAAVAGALAGIVYGMDAIPAEWLDTLRGKDVIEACLF